MSEEATEFRVVSLSSSEFKLRGQWIVELPGENGRDMVKSPFFGFHEFAFRLLLNLSSPHLQFVIELNQNSQGRFAAVVCVSVVSLSSVLPSLSRGDTFSFTRASNCAFINFDVNARSIFDYAKEGKLKVKFAFEHRQRPSMKKWNSDTVYAGLSNQGATCYLNSLLQAFFHLPAFRMIVYQIPIDESKDKSSSIPYNLQQLFVRMQSGGTSCSTKALTTAFGWKTADAFMQRDIQELCRVFIENLERAVQGTPLSDKIADLFRGTMEQYVKCVNVECETSHIEDFYDLSLDVEGCRTLYGSLRRFTEPERLAGANQYETPDYGKQDAIIGTKLVKLPPVLYLHLRRFKYDAQVNGLMKVNDRFEFPTHLDMSEFVGTGKDHKYELFGVLVHSGSAQFGHYYAYIRPTVNDTWFEFNDSTVRPIDADLVVANSYGNIGRQDSAYMLIYCRCSEINRLFDSSYGTVQRSIGDDEEQQDDDEGVRVITECDLRSECGELDLRTSNDSGIFCLPDGSASKKQLVELAAEFLGFPARKVAIWTMDGEVLERIMPENVSLHPFRLRKMNIFAKISESAVSSGDLIVFIKYFAFDDDPKIRMLTSHVTNASLAVGTILPMARELLGFAPDVPMLLFKKRLRATFEPLALASTFVENNLSNGSTLVCQLDPSVPLIEPLFPFGETVMPSKANERDEKLEVVEIGVSQSQATVADYADSKYNMGNAVISKFEEPTVHLFVLRYPRKLELCDVKTAIAARMNLAYDPTKNAMQIYSKCVGENEPGTVALTRFSMGYNRLFFRYFLEVSEEELNDLMPVKFRISNDETQTILIKKQSTIEQLLARLEIKPDESLVAEDSFGYDLKLLAMDVDASKITGIIRIGKKEELSEDQKLCPVCHPRACTLFTPLFFILNKGEKLVDTKKRLRETLELDEKVFNDLTFSFRKRSSIGISTSAITSLASATELFPACSPDCSIYLSEKPQYKAMTDSTPIINS